MLRLAAAVCTATNPTGISATRTRRAMGTALRQRADLAGAIEGNAGATPASTGMGLKGEDGWEFRCRTPPPEAEVTAGNNTTQLPGPDAEIPGGLHKMCGISLQAKNHPRSRFFDRQE